MEKTVKEVLQLIKENEQYSKQLRKVQRLRSQLSKENKILKDMRKRNDER